MFSYSMQLPSATFGMGLEQYTLPYDYMMGNSNNMNYLYNSLSMMNPYMMQGYNFFNPNFEENKVSDSSKKQKKELEYTPVYASDEIYASSTSEKNKKDNSHYKPFAIGTAIVAGLGLISCFVNGAKSFNGTFGQYLGSLFKKCGSGTKSLFDNTLGKVGQGTKWVWGKTSAGCSKAFNGVANCAKKSWSKVASCVMKFLK